jgi:ribosomal protein S27AE
MPQPNRPDPSPLPPIARRRCPRCGLQLFLSCIEPTYHPDYEVRSYDCSMCDYEETVAVKCR